MSALLRRFAADESGQAMVLVALFLPALIAVAGLVTDGGMVFAERRDLQNVADAAAAAGAMQINQDTYRASGGQVVALDWAPAYTAAATRLAQEGGLSYTVWVMPWAVQVYATRRVPMHFLSLVGIGGVWIHANAGAQPRPGVYGSVP
ncbi:MAG: pilus assembly protein TadG-related protein [Dehalococcoidia bacterium]